MTGLSQFSFWLPSSIAVAVVLVVSQMSAADKQALTSIGPDELAGGTITICWKPDFDANPSANLLIHFHGGDQFAKRAFKSSKINCVVAIVNFRGLSSAYSTPFRTQPRLFLEIQSHAARVLRETGQLDRQIEWKQLWLSSFSAGFGAMREILKTPAYFDSIDGLIAADSIYAGLQSERPQRVVNETHMQDFRRFAELATVGKKTFLITHSAQTTPYASTTETADDLLGSLKIARQQQPETADTQWVLASRAIRGRFEVLGYRGQEGVDHLKHLWNINLIWDRFARLSKTNVPTRP